MISPLAYIHPEAIIGENVEIGPFVYIDKNVVIRGYSARPEVQRRRNHGGNRR